MAMDKAKLILASKPKLETIEIDGDSLCISEISQEAYDEIIECAENKKADGEQNWHKTMTSLIIKSVVNADGSAMFAEEDAPIVSKFCREVRKKITDACLKANGFNADEKKPSEPTTNGSENGESQLDLDLDTPQN